MRFRSTGTSRRARVQGGGRETADHDTETPEEVGGGRAATVLARVSRYWALLFLVTLVVVFSITAPYFVTLDTLQNVLVAASIPLVAALGQTVVVISAGIDLSIAYSIGMAAVVEALLITDFAGHMPLAIALILAIVVTLIAVGLAGAVNGAGIALLRVPAFIMTLGMYGVASGIAFLLSGGPAVAGLPDQVGTIGNGYLVNIYHGHVSFFTAPAGAPGFEVHRYVPTVVLVAAALVAVMQYVMSSTRFGQHVYAIGGNAEAARRAGIPVTRRLVQIYVISALLATFAGTLSVFRFQAGSPTAGVDILIDSLAAVVIGGTSLFGGRGTITGTVIGALLIAVLQIGLILQNVNPFWQYIAVGLVIIVAVVVAQARAGVVHRLQRAYRTRQSRPWD